MKRVFILKIIAAFCCIAAMRNLYSDQILTIFLKPYPKVPRRQDAQRFSQQLSHPMHTAQSTLENRYSMCPLGGIMATYAGFLTISDANGQLSFPLRHDTTRIHVVITPIITPVMMVSNTLHHWEFEIGTPAAMYLIERKLDPETQITYWHTQELALPKNNEIPLEAMILFDEPKDIYVPIGITPIQQTPHFVLPDIYLKNNQTASQEALYVLNLRFLFGPIVKLYDKKPTTLLEHISQ